MTATRPRARKVRRLLGVLLGAALLAAGVPPVGGTFTLQAAEALPRVQKAVRTIVRKAPFHSDGQSLWGPGTKEGLVSDVPFFDLSWNESGSAGGIQSTCLDIIPPPQGCGLPADFGARLEGTTSGRVGLGAHYSLTAGDLTIDYPVRLTLQVPGSFTPGRWTAVTSGLEVLPDAGISTVSPDGHIDLNGIFGFSASAKAKACVVSCTEVDPSVDIPTSSGRIFRINSADVHTFSAAALQELGLFGSVQLPDLSVGATTVDPDGSMSASGSGEYAGLGISAIEWAQKLAGIELPLNFDLPACCGVTVQYTTFDSSFSATAEAAMALRFVPKVAISLQLPAAFDYEVLKLDGSRETGRAERIAFRAGEKVRIHIPRGAATRIRIIPRARIDRPTLLNSATSDISFGGDVGALAVNTTVPSYPPFFPGIDLHLGPVYEDSYPIADLPTIDVWSDKWSVGGFSEIAMRPFYLAPP